MTHFALRGGLKIAALAAFVAITNSGIVERIELLLRQDRGTTAIMFLGVWAFCMGALFIAAFQPKARWRWGWGVVIALTTFAGYAYYRVSSSQLTVMDVFSLWNSKADSGRAAEFYAYDVSIAALVAFGGLLAIGLRPPRMAHWFERLLSWFRPAPVAPVLVILAIIVLKSGGGTHALPQQFSPAAMGLLVTAKAATHELPTREILSAKPERPAAARHLFVVVDESVRPDYLNFEQGNIDTPYMAAHPDRFIDFGRAASGNNCSHYSNAMLRLGAGVNDVITTVRTSPNIWKYAKRAGFRTVYIDATASHNKNSGSLHNFMTAKERAEDIDEYILLDGIPPADLDMVLADRLIEMSRRETPHFIISNKTGAHFPYDNSYPETERVFRPTMSDAPADELAGRINSYKNALRWATDGFFKKMLPQMDLANTLILYTSDHGQNFMPGRQTHCSTKDADPREGLVPLMAITDDGPLASRFEKAARLNHDRASHFTIFPTLLTVMGYDTSALGPAYGASLFEKIEAPQRFTAGDVFGLFSDEVTWTAIDSARDMKIKFPVADKHKPMAGLSR